MDIFIKSQDEKFFGKVDGFTVIESLMKSRPNKYYIQGSNFQNLGAYSTQERCMEILNEIQKLLATTGIVICKNIDITPEVQEYLKYEALCTYDDTNESSTTIHSNGVIVYEMPKE